MHLAIGLNGFPAVDVDHMVAEVSCPVTVVGIGASAELWILAHRHLRRLLEHDKLLDPKAPMCGVVSSLPHPWLCVTDGEDGQLNRVNVHLMPGERASLVDVKALTANVDPEHGSSVPFRSSPWRVCPHAHLAPADEDLPVAPTTSGLLAECSGLLRQLTIFKPPFVTNPPTRVLEAIYYYLWIGELARVPHSAASVARALQSEPLLLELLEIAQDRFGPSPLLKNIASPEEDVLSVAMDDLMQQHHANYSVKSTKVSNAGLAALLCADGEQQRRYAALETFIARREFVDSLPAAPPSSMWTRLLGNKELTVELKCRIVQMRGRVWVVDECRKRLEDSEDTRAVFLTFVNDAVAGASNTPPASAVVSVATRKSLPPMAQAGTGAGAAVAPSSGMLMSVVCSVKDMGVDQAATCCTNLHGLLRWQLSGLGCAQEMFQIMYLCPNAGSYLDLHRAGLEWTPALSQHLPFLEHDISTARVRARHGRFFVLLSASPGVHEFVLKRLGRLDGLAGEVVLTASPAPARHASLLPAGPPTAQLAQRLDVEEATLAQSLAPVVCPRGGISELRHLMGAHGLLSSVPELPVEVCRRVLQQRPLDAQAQALALGWLLLHDLWFWRVHMRAMALFGDAAAAWHPDDPAAALTAAVALVCDRPAREDELTSSSWFRGLRSYAQSCAPAAAAESLARGSEGLVAPKPTGDALAPWDALVRWAMDSGGAQPLEETDDALDMPRPHWFVSPGGSLQQLADAVGPRLMARHLVPVLWHGDVVHGRNAILLGVADDDAALARNVPCMVNNMPVVLVLSRDERTPFAARDRWTLPAPEVEELNAAMALCACDFFRRHPRVVALTGGRAQRNGAVFYQLPPRIVAFVEAESGSSWELELSSQQLGGFRLDFEPAPPLHARLATTPEGPPDASESKSEWKKYLLDLGPPIPLHIGEWIDRQRANGTSYKGCKGTLGCFGVLADGQRVALTAGHCLTGTADPEIQANDKFTRDYLHSMKEVQSFLPKTLMESLSATLASGADATCIMIKTYEADSNFAGADNLHHGVSAKEPLGPPSRIDTLDFGMLRIGNLPIQPGVIGTLWHWAKVGRPVLSFTGEVAASEPVAIAATAADPGDGALFKFGRTTGLTVGTVVGTYVFQPGGAGGKAQRRIKVRGWRNWHFGEPGDSGSLVVDAHGDAVGILLQSWPKFEFEVVAPIGHVMEALGVNHLLSFGNVN